jgi:hypothetical protein
MVSYTPRTNGIYVVCLFKWLIFHGDSKIPSERARNIMIL